MSAVSEHVSGGGVRTETLPLCWMPQSRASGPGLGEAKAAAGVMERLEGLGSRERQS